MAVVRKALSFRASANVNSPASVLLLLQSLADSDCEVDGIYDVLLFLNRGKELLGSANSSGETLLMAAAYHGRLDWVDRLLAEPAARQTINARD